MRGVLLTVALLVSACASPATSSIPPTTTPSPTSPPPTQEATPIPGCLPDCVPGALTRPGPLQAGDYQTRYFFGGLFTVTVPEGYVGHEDSTGELGLQTSNPDGPRLMFWLDVYPIVDQNRAPVEGIEMSADGVLSWIADNPNVAVISREPSAIGPLAGEALEFGRSPDAVNVDPTCPDFLRPCVALVDFPQWDAVFGEGGPFHMRIVAADATWGGENHVVYALINAANDGAFADVREDFLGIIASAQMPPGVTQ